LAAGSPDSSRKTLGLYRDCPGDEAGLSSVFCFGLDAHAPESKTERQRFAAMPSELQRLSTWLREQGVEEAVMESTAQYWRSVWLELEPHIVEPDARPRSDRRPERLQLPNTSGPA
jgi:hypothetical protein